MFDIDMLIGFVFMALFFLRQMSIIKEPDKISYAPLVLIIGIMASIVHFVLFDASADPVSAIKESLIPMLVSLFLYIIMNILAQTSNTQRSKEQNELTKRLMEDMEELKEFSAELERKIILNQNYEKQLQGEGREKFKHDLKALDSILINQNRFLEKIDEFEHWHGDVKKSLQEFTEVQIPSLDNVMHKHIDILRVAEQDHFNKVKSILLKAIEGRNDIQEEIKSLKDGLSNIQNISHTISKSIIQHTLERLSEVTSSYEKEMHLLKSHAQAVDTSLYESESRLSNIKDQSEMIIKQMVLSSNKMGELQAKNDSLYDTYTKMKELAADIEAIKSEYVKSQSQLGMILKEYREIKESESSVIRKEFDSLGEVLCGRVEESLSRLDEHYNSAKEDISQSVKFLSKQAQLKTRYTDLDSK